MKKFYIIILCLFLNAGIHAQQSDNLRFGLIGGLNYSHFNGGSTENFYSRAGFQIGGYAQHNITENFTIQPEIILTLKGASEDVNAGTNELTFTFKFTYLEVPILLKYQLISNPNVPVRPHLFVGPAIALRLSAELEGDLNGETASESLKDYKQMDFGMVFGGGLTIPSGGSDILIVLKYTLGLVEINKSQGYPSHFKNGVFTLGFGVTI